MTALSQRLDGGYRLIQADGDGDMADVAALFRTYAATLPMPLDYQHFDTELATLPGAYASPRGGLWLVRDDAGTSVGCLAMRPMAKTGDAEVKRLYVAPEHRGHGLGRALFAAMIDAARAAGYSQLWLDSLPDMHAALALYRAFGFVPTEAYYDTPVAGTLFFRKPL